MPKNLLLLFARSIGLAAIAFLVIGISGWGYWAASSEQNDASQMVDIDWAGRHLCPNKRNPEFDRPYPPNLNRPDEDQLWKARLQIEGDRTREFFKQTTMNSVKGEPLAQEVNHSLADYHKNETHYRVEVRRTIHEMESGHPLSLASRGRLRMDEDPRIDQAIGVPLVQSSCELLFPNHAHECARADVLNWYADRRVYPINSIRRTASTVKK